MNKQELINDLESKSFVKQLTGLEDTQLASENLKLYAQHYIETNGLVAKETKAHIFVIDEGLETEVAYYKDREPESSVQPTHPLVKKYQETIESVDGEVVKKGNGFIVVQGYIDKKKKDESGQVVVVDGKEVIDKIPKTWFAEEIDGVLDIKEIPNE